MGAKHPWEFWCGSGTATHRASTHLNHVLYDIGGSIMRSSKQSKNPQWVSQWLLIAGVLLLGLSLIFGPLLIGKAHSQGEVRGFHNEHHHSRLHHWYQKLMRPDNPSVSCCSSNDCTPTQAYRLEDGSWKALKAGRWISVPQSKINSEESPDGYAHICFYPQAVENDDILCFVKPGSLL